MGSGTMELKTYKTKRGYYLSHGFDERLGGNFSFLILPLFGNDDERFFYVKKLDNGKYEVEGEGYICTRNEFFRSHLRSNSIELSGKPIWYYHLDDKWNIVRKEKGHEF